MGTFRGTAEQVPPRPAAIVRVTARSSTVEVHGKPGAEVSAVGGTVVVDADGTIEVIPGSGTVRVTCGEHDTVVVSTASGNVSMHGHIAVVQVLTSNGRVHIDRAVDAEVRSASGAVRIGACEHRCRVVTKSGTVTVGEAHDVDISTASARVHIGRAVVAAVNTISGSIDLGIGLLGRVTARTMSGSVEITVPEGAPATTSLTTRSGRVRNEVPGGDGPDLMVCTGSGGIRIRPQ